MPFTNNGGRDSALRSPRRRAERQTTENTGLLPCSFRPAGRGRRSAASLPTAWFVIWIIPFFGDCAVDKLSGQGAPLRARRRLATHAFGGQRTARPTKLQILASTIRCGESENSLASPRSTKFMGA